VPVEFLHGTSLKSTDFSGKARPDSLFTYAYSSWGRHMTVETPDIQAMIEGAQNGDEAAKGQLFERCRPYLRILAQRQITGALARRLDPSDVVQQTLLEAHRDFRDFVGASEPELAAWLERILAHNVAETIRFHAITAKRAVGREEPAGGCAKATAGWQELPEDSSSPSQRAMRGEEALRLARAMEGLPHAQREAVRLRHLEGWPLARIASELGKSVPATAGLIKRGMQSLRHKLMEP
jgi:RNA polymerase sigma-70 factor, ECF subfamily